MNLAKYLSTATAALLLALTAPAASAQTTSSTPSWSCTFAQSSTDCGFYLQAAAPDRATLVNTAIDGATAVQLETQPGDSNLFGSGTNERADLSLSQEATGCYQGAEQWWSHSILFPDGYVVPPAGSTWNWGIVFDFHHTGSTGQPNFEIVSLPTGLYFWGAGGLTEVNSPGDPGFFQAPIGPVVKNVWYNFVYHVKWSSGSDGFFKAWVNGVLKLDHVGPTLYAGEGCYLKLANYHTPIGQSVSVIHDRVMLGSTQNAVALTPLVSVNRTVHNDFDGDGKSDILWRNGATGQDVLWLMNGATLASGPSLASVTDSNWKIAASGDFDGDGKADILWRNSASGANQIWFMNGGTLLRANNLPNVADMNWGIAGVGDFDGDGKSDILWRNSATGQNQIWFMNGATLVSGPSITTVSDLHWSVSGIGDFNGDGKSDVLWRNNVTGQNVVFFMNGQTVLSNPYINQVSDLNWSIAGVGDFDGDGKSDVLWRNKSTGENAIFFMNGPTVTSTTFITPISDPAWRVASVGDFDGDGKSDILWRNSATGSDGIYFMNAGNVTQVSFIATVPLTGWAVAAP